MVLLGLGTGPTRAEVDAEQQATVNKALESVKRFATDPDMQWFRNNVGKAKGVLIVPVSVKAGFIIGGSGDVGVFLARGEASDWSYPAFYQPASVTFGLQAGGDVSEIMMLVMSEKGRNALLTTEFKLGGEVSVAAGPVGAGAEAQTADVLAFSRTEGAFFRSLNVEGSVVNPKNDWNSLYYGEPVTPIRSGRRCPRPQELVDRHKIGDAGGATAPDMGMAAAGLVPP
jgi:lipid-binding SYLF domain-containing protein